jgi:hypothetical protein
MTATPMPPTGNGADQDDEACLEAAAQIRRQRPNWVIIWLARTSQFRAWPLFRAPRDTSVTARTPDELTASMDQIEQAASSRRARSRRMDSAT